MRVETGTRRSTAGTGHAVSAVVWMDVARAADAEAIATLRTAAADDLTRRYGDGHWSSTVSPRGVLRGIRDSRILVARVGDAIVGTLRLAAKKPWAVDTAYFTPVPRPLYLVDMAVAPPMQGQGVGRLLLEEAAAAARRWPADAIRLDAYDADAGAGGFYAACGFAEVGRVVYRRVPLVYFERLSSNF
jgi:GNAT superfamily N-acetyltransferase